MNNLSIHREAVGPAARCDTGVNFGSRIFVVPRWLAPAKAIYAYITLPRVGERWSAPRPFLSLYMSHFISSRYDVRCKLPPI